MNRIGIGRTAEAFEIDNDKILKLYYDSVSHDSVKNEHDISTMISSKISNTPKVFELVTKENRLGIVFQKIQGPHMAKVMLQNPSAIPDLVYKFSELHKSILDASITSDNLTINDVTGIIERCRKSEMLTELEKDVVERFLSATDAKQLCHGDFHPENVLVADDGALWVIDWATAVLCNRMFDIARTYYLLRYAQSPEKKPVYVRAVEIIACKYISHAYYRNMITTREDKEMLECFFFVILLLRYNEGITEEQGLVGKLIRKNRKTAIREMERYLNS